jgi:hypothetical protein
VELLKNYYLSQIQLKRNTLWREQDRQKCQKEKEKEIQANHKKAIEKQIRILKTKNIVSDTIHDYAERDVDILSGKNRTRHSMRS